MSEPSVDVGPRSRWFSRFRILKSDCEAHGYTGDCIRCTRLQLGDNKTSTNHSEECRESMYKKLHKARDPRFMKALRNSPEFLKRMRAIEDHELAEEEAAVPEALDDDLGDHILEDDVVDDVGHPSSSSRLS